MMSLQYKLDKTVGEQGRLLDDKITSMLCMKSGFK